METSSDGGLTWNVLTPTTTGSIGASVTSGAGKLITWNAGVDYNDQEKSQMRIRLTGIDSFGNTSAPLSSSDFILDTAPPAGLSAFSQFLATTSSISFVWASGVTDAHFNRYELWYGTVQGDVEGRTGGARKWSTENDSALALSATNATTIGTGLQQGTDYFVELYAFDDNGSGSTTAGIYARLASPQAAVVFGTVLPTPLPTVTAPTLVPVPGPTPQAPSIPQPATIILPEVRPTLTALTTPTNNTNTAISGLASPGSAIELYDAGTLIARLSAPANNQGEFQQTILLGSGAHALTVKSLDASGSRSDASLPVPLTIDTTSPSAPIITSPLNGEIVSTDILTLAGAGEPRVTLEITLDGSRRFTTAVNPAGTWSFILPDAFALLAGGHTFSVVARDEAGNSSPASNVSVTRIILPILITPVISRVTPIPVQRPLVSIPIARPAAELIREVSTAIEVPSLPPPQVVTASTATTTAPGLFTNDIIDFSGTALPNEDVIIYIHSEQAVIYRAKADSAGKWTFKHSQNEIELTPGVHTIYAVGLDPVAKVKTRPSLVKTFVVEKNWWVVIYNYLNFYSTAVSLIVILLILAWLYRREHRTRTVS